jgi:crotonobetainyl-CoA:carnitine CoA-transferase CaiB-like acyl-CoA transferase
VTGALDGVIVADLSRVLAGPYATMLLADLGATVIKVESPEGDETRQYRPPQFEGESTYYLSINRNKRSIALDFADPGDLRIARDLVQRADIVVENFKPNGLERFGLDYASVTRGNPSVVYTSISGFGTAAGAELPGYDLLVQALSGMMSLTGSPDDVPYRSGVAVFDVITGLHAAIGTLAALHHRTLTGEGQHVELNLLSSALSGLVNQTGAFAIAGVVPQRMGNEHPSLYPYAPFPTADGDIVIALGNDALFRTLCVQLGRPELADDPRFARAADRSANRDQLRPLLNAALSPRSAASWAEVLQAARVPSAPILDVRGGIQTAEGLGLAPIVRAGVGERAVPGIRNPIDLSRTPAGYDRPPPRLDEDRADVVRWLSGGALDQPVPVGAAARAGETR